MRDQLKAHIIAMLEGIRHLSIDDAADLLAEVADELADGGPADLFNGAILDGIRWGYEAAVRVELGGGAMLRVTLPGGIGITHEWASEVDAQPQIKAALARLHAARVTASNAGDDE
jgi:hypothetical protein